MDETVKICPHCAFENPQGAKFCQNCGKPMERACPNCHMLNAIGAKFCQNCGYDLHGGDGGIQETRLEALKDAAPLPLKEKLRLAKTEIDGERKPVAILFADVVGSTTIAEKLDPEEWKELIAGAHQRLGEAIYRYEGTIAQLLGDGLLAFFGAPITHEDDPLRAVSAALDMLDAIGEYQQEVKGMVDGFQIRVGINYGTVVIGDIGTDLHEEYLAVGDAVNVAARLQSTADPGAVVVSDSIARFIQPAFDLSELGSLELKGKETPVTAFQILGPKKILERQRGIAGLRASLIGRDPELATLRETISSLREGRGQIVALMGEAGIGKSRLLEEIRISEQVEDTGNGHQPAIHWLEGRSLSYGGGLSYWPITQIILSDLGLSEGDPEIKIKAALRRRVSDLSAQESSDLLPFIFHLLGLRQDPAEGDRLDRLDSETLKHQVLLSLTRYIDRLSTERPTVLVFEDLHWSDPSTLEVLEHLLPLADRRPLMLLMVMRIVFEHGSWPLKMKAESEVAHRFTEIELKRLSPTESNQMVDQMLEIADLPIRVREIIQARAEGNPFYLEEIIRHLIDNGAIVQSEGSWQTTDEIERIDIPETLQGVLLARIDRLEEQVRSTLQLASVIGRSFLYRLLEAISEAERELEIHLSTLQRADLVREKARWPELEYIFKHALTQQAAYNSLLIERRKRFHRQVGEAIEALFSDRQEEFLGLLAHHFDAAGELDKAQSYLLRAGDKARLEDALLEAAEFYKRALNIMDQDAQPNISAHTWLKLGLIHQMTFDFDAAREANESAFNFVEQTSSTLRGKERSPQGGEHSPFTLRFMNVHSPTTLDPGTSYWQHEREIIDNIFAGLVELDSESNIVPHVARSWEVLDGGRRYIFHLREDVRWTDGAKLTASDFVWAWRRNLHPHTESLAARLLDDVVGAYEFRTGESTDPESIGIRALDDYTLEITLERPVAYFVYIAAHGITFPLPQRVIEEFGEDWWLPGNIISNGPFRLTEFIGDKLELERNTSYFGTFPGNVEKTTYRFSDEEKNRASAYLDGKIDVLWDLRSAHIPSEITPIEIRRVSHDLGLVGFILNPTMPPMDDRRVRMAIAHAFNRGKLVQAMGIPVPRSPQGGIVPLGLAGHSPELGLNHDVEQARRLLTEAGYPEGRGFPEITLTSTRRRREFIEEIHRQLNEGLGIDVKMIETGPYDRNERRLGHVTVLGWSADYPDADNFLHKSSFYTDLKVLGWKNEEYEQLIHSAAILQDRPKRLAMYRQADRLLVEQGALVYPVAYAGQGAFTDLAKPWVKNLTRNTLGQIHLKEIVIEEET